VRGVQEAHQKTPTRYPKQQMKLQ
jgi:hypothetical protein